MDNSRIVIGVLFWKCWLSGTRSAVSIHQLPAALASLNVAVFVPLPLVSLLWLHCTYSIRQNQQRTRIAKKQRERERARARDRSRKEIQNKSDRQFVPAVEGTQRGGSLRLLLK
jgi:hypothetical protein